MQALTIQLQVIYAVLLRETKTRFGEHQLGYVWALIEPLLWVSTIGALFYLLGRAHPPGMPMVPFLVTGIVPYILFRETSARSLSAINANKGLLYYPHVRPLDLVLARMLPEWVTKFAVFAVLMGAFALYEGQLAIDSPLRTIFGLALACGLGAGVGLAFCGLSVFSPTTERLHWSFAAPTFWLSGVFYLVDGMPTAARNVLLYNPLLHAIELVRGGWFPAHESRYVSAWYPALWIVILLFFGLSLERIARRRIQLS